MGSGPSTPQAAIQRARSTIANGKFRAYGGARRYHVDLRLLYEGKFETLFAIKMN